MIGVSIAFIVVVLAVALSWLFIPNDNKSKNDKISELEKENRELRLKQSELIEEIRTLRYAIVLDLDYPIDNSLQQAKDAIRLEYPDIKFRDEQ
jgi:hypothetical protein